SQNQLYQRMGHFFILNYYFTFVIWDNLQYDLCMIIVGITVSLSGFLSPFVMAWILTVIGLLGTFIFYFITPKLDILKDKAIKEEMRI
ncbi:hypothetical protein ABEU95_15980, partial [Heyndrickxia faecalis]